MSKIIEMTMDGRLSIIWIAVIMLILVWVVEGWISRRDRTRRVPGSQRHRKH